jgi:hypothetical protein
LTKVLPVMTVKLLLVGAFMPDRLGGVGVVLEPAPSPIKPRSVVVVGALGLAKPVILGDWLYERPALPLFGLVLCMTNPSSLAALALAAVLAS